MDVRRSLQAAVVLWAAGVFLSGCGAFFTVTREEPPHPAFKPYTQIHVGWVAFPEEDWQTHGFGTKQEWVGQIQAFNTTGLQAYVKEWMPDLQVSGDQAKDQGMPASGELYLKFDYRGLVKHDSAMSGHLDELTLGVEFIELATRQPVYKAEVVITSRGFHSRGWKQHSFDGRLDNQMYNLANWIKERLRG